MQGTDNKSSRTSGSVQGIVVMVVAYSNIVLNSIIYMLRYDVVRSSLMKWVRETAAKLRNQPPPD